MTKWANEESRRMGGKGRGPLNYITRIPHIGRFAFRNLVRADEMYTKKYTMKKFTVRVRVRCDAVRCGVVVWCWVWGRW